MMPADTSWHNLATSEETDFNGFRNPLETNGIYTAFQEVAFRTLKSHLLASEKPPLGMQEATSCKTADVWRNIALLSLLVNKTMSKTSPLKEKSVHLQQITVL